MDDNTPLSAAELLELNREIQGSPTVRLLTANNLGLYATLMERHLAGGIIPETELVVLLERDRLTSGTTWHSAGLICTFGSTSETSTELRKYTRDLYARLFYKILDEPTRCLPPDAGAVEFIDQQNRSGPFRRIERLQQWSPGEKAFGKNIAPEPFPIKLTGERIYGVKGK